MANLSINARLGKTLDWGAKKFTKQLEKGLKHPAQFAATMLVTSIVSKDLVGCVIYTSQSATNQKIPEDKRTFVALTDLMNGIIMVGGQFMVGKIIEAKLTPKLESHYTGAVVNKDKKIVGDTNPNRIYSPDTIMEDVRKDILSNLEEYKKIYPDVEKNMTKVCKQVAKELGRGSGKCKAFATGFGILVTALATNALTKRTLAPLLSTPLASAVENHYFKGKKKDPQLERVVAEEIYKNNDVSSPKREAFKSFA